MWPTRRDELRVGLCPDRLVVARFQGGFARRRVDEKVYPVTGNPVETLKQVVGNEDICVVLSSYLVRHQILSWSDALASEDDWMAYAQHRFAATYGDEAKRWDTRVSEAAKGKARVATAVERSLVDSLNEIPTVISIQPYLMAAFNAYRRALPSASWLLLHEPGRFTIGLVLESTWKVARTRQAPFRWQDTVADLLDREASAIGDENCDHVAVYSESQAPTNAGRYRITDLREPETDQAAFHVRAMALA